MRNKTVFTFTADIEDTRHTTPVCIAFHRNKRLLDPNVNYSGEADREFDLRDSILTLVEQREGKGPFRFRNAVLTVTIFGRNGPRSRCVDPFASEWTEEFAKVVDPDWRVAA